MHADLYKKALESLEDGGDMQAESFHLCPVCGYVAENAAPERCPVCGAKDSSFQEF